MKITVTVRCEDGDEAVVDTLDSDQESVTGFVVVLRRPGQTTIELVKPGQTVVIQDVQETQSGVPVAKTET
jgi:hypothetical protein